MGNHFGDSVATAVWENIAIERIKTHELEENLLDKVQQPLAKESVIRLGKILTDVGTN